MKDDLISRQAAIDAGLRLCGRDTKAELINLCEASIADSEGWAGGILDYMGELEDLPSAQPEIVRCKDCKHSEHWYGDKARCFLWEEFGIDVWEDGFCNYAERREK